MPYNVMLVSAVQRSESAICIHISSQSNQSILKEINTEYSLEGLILKLKLQYFGYLVQTSDILEKTLMLRKNKGRRRRGRQRTRWLDGITNPIDMIFSKLSGSAGKESVCNVKTCVRSLG